jgi:hypothetical protein
MEIPENQDPEKATGASKVRISEASPSLLAQRKTSTRREGVRLRDLFPTQKDTDTSDEDVRPPMLVLTSLRGPRVPNQGGFFQRIRRSRSKAAKAKAKARPRQTAPQSSLIDPAITNIEFLHRYNVLYSRAKLLRHFEAKRDLVDDNVSGDIFQDLKNHCEPAILGSNPGNFLTSR